MNKRLTGRTTASRDHGTWRDPSREDPRIINACAILCEVVLPRRRKGKRRRSRGLRRRRAHTPRDAHIFVVGRPRGAVSSAWLYRTPRATSARLVFRLLCDRVRRVASFFFLSARFISKPMRDNENGWRYRRLYTTLVSITPRDSRCLISPRRLSVPQDIRPRVVRTTCYYYCDCCCRRGRPQYTRARARPQQYSAVGVHPRRVCVILCVTIL